MIVERRVKTLSFYSQKRNNQQHGWRRYHYLVFWHCIELNKDAVPLWMSGFSLTVCKCNDASNVIVLKSYENSTQP